MQLLAVGRSFIGLRSGQGRFKPAAAGSLPNFGAGEFEMHSPAARSPEAGEAGLENRKAAAVSMTAAASPIPLASALTPASRPALKKSPRFGNPLASLLSPRPARSLVQAELSLESVKVVRNDLSEADLMVVSTRKQKPAAAPAREPEANPFAAPAGKTAARELVS